MNFKQDVQEFFKKSYEEIYAPLRKAGGTEPLRRSIFKDANEMNRAALHDLYLSERFLPFLFAVGCIGGDYFTSLSKRSAQEHCAWLIATEKYPNPDGIKVLDYGCGSAFLSIKLALMGYDVTLMDIPHKFFRFIQYLVEKHRIQNIGFADITLKENDIVGQMDYVICSEVLEHVYDPVATLKNLCSHLKIGGWMYLSHWFEDDHGSDPSHLKRNNKYRDFDSFTEAEGLVPLVKNEGNTFKGFQKKG